MLFVNKIDDPSRICTSVISRNSITSNNTEFEHTDSKIRFTSYDKAKNVLEF